MEDAVGHRDLAFGGLPSKTSLYIFQKLPGLEWADLVAPLHEYRPISELPFPARVISSQSEGSKTYRQEK